jgi:hypothetical protein
MKALKVSKSRTSPTASSRSQLEGMGVTPKDIVEYRRIEARLDEAAARAHEVARVAQPSTSQHNTRSKGKAVEGAIAEARNHLRQLQEDEMHF